MACEKIDTNQSEKMVIEAFLYEGEPVDDIRITSLLSFGGTDTIPQPINDAKVSIIWEEEEYELQNYHDSGYYRYPFLNLKVNAGEIYQLKVELNGNEANALTLCPQPPQNITISKDTLKIELFSLLDSLLSGGNIEEPDPDSIVVKWDNPNNEYFFVVAENIEPIKEAIYPEFLGIIGDFFFQTQPTNSNEYLLWDLDFRHFGRHQVRVYKVNQEYVDLYQSFEQDSRTQAEPLTNVINGLGIFTAVNYETVEIYVSK